MGEHGIREKQQDCNENSFSAGLGETVVDNNGGGNGYRSDERAWSEKVDLLVQIVTEQKADRGYGKPETPMTSRTPTMMSLTFIASAQGIGQRQDQRQS